MARSDTASRRWARGLVTALVVAHPSSSAIGQVPRDASGTVPVDTVVRRMGTALPGGRIIRQLVSRTDTSQR